MSSATCFPALVMQMIAFVYAAKIQESRINCAFSTLRRFRNCYFFMKLCKCSLIMKGFFGVLMGCGFKVWFMHTEVSDGKL